MPAAITNKPGGGAPAGAAYTLFDTAIGRCGIAWRGDFVAAFALPEADDALTCGRLLRLLPDAVAAGPGGPVQAAIDAVRRLFDGTDADLRSISISLNDVPAFDQRVYDLLRDVPAGQTITYGELARRAGSPGAAQAVGMAMSRNPIPVIIPCHRVLAQSGRSGGFTSPGGVSTKFRILQIEQAGSNDAGLLFADLPLALRR